MSADRWFGLVFAAVGLGLAVFHRPLARWQIERNRRFYATPEGRWLMIALSYLVPAAWVVIGGLAFLDRLSTSGPPARPVPDIGLKEGQVVGLAAFIVGALLLAFRGRWMRWNERWYFSPAGETFASRYMLLAGLVFAAAGLLQALGILS